MTPPWDPRALFSTADPSVRGADAQEAAVAIRAAEDVIDFGDHDGIIAYRQPRTIVFQPWTQHRHDQDCNRA